MSKKALTDEKYELIKAHILDPENSPLPEHLQGQLDRIVSMAKVLDKNPRLKHAVAIHRSKFPELSDTTAYRDARLARKIYNSLHEFDYDFWLSWLINDITKNIKFCRDQGKDAFQYRRVIAMEHANLIKAIGERPKDLPDPKRNEKHNFYLLVQINNQNVKIDLNNLHKLPEDTLRELNKALSSGIEINEIQAKSIMNS
jgi:hypothetical protein